MLKGKPLCVFLDGVMTALKYVIIGVVVVVVVVAGVLGAMLFITNQNYVALQAQYAGLQSMYNSLKSNYSSLESQYNNLLAMYAKLNSNYSQLLSDYHNLQVQYNQLQGQYQQLQSQYSYIYSQYNSLETSYNQLQSKYNNLVRTFSGSESYIYEGYVDPGGSLMFVVVVPNGFTATVNIYASSSDYIGVLVTTQTDMNIAMSVVPTGTPATLYTWSGYTISQQITLQPDIYIIGMYNYPNNTAGAYINVQITTSLNS
jgi:flagellar basal body-associated protein FliL